MQNLKRFSLLSKWILAGGLALLSPGCSDDAESPPPTLTSFSPQSASAGETVIITGAHFSTAPDENEVTFNNTQAIITAATTTQLTTTVPAGATTGKVSVTVKNKTVVSTHDFIVLPGETREETPLATFLESGSFDFQTIQDGQLYSLGYEFSVKKNGAITAMGLASPVAGIFDVELYEVSAGGASGTLIGETTVEITQAEIDQNAHAIKFADIDNPVAISTGKSYRVAYSTYAGKEALYRLNDQTGFDLPLQANTTQVIISKGLYGAPGTYPNALVWNDDILYLADVKFIYQE